MSTTVAVWNPNHWTTREVPLAFFRQDMCPPGHTAVCQISINNLANSRVQGLWPGLLGFGWLLIYFTITLFNKFKKEKTESAQQRQGKGKGKSLSCARLLATPWTAAYQAPLSMDFPGKSTGVGWHCLLCQQRQGLYKKDINGNSRNNTLDAITADQTLWKKA